MSVINYNHELNPHRIEGPLAATRILSEVINPRSILDVGCGIGTWLYAASQNGVEDYMGVDGVNINNDQLLITPSAFRVHDLTQPLDVGRKFDLVLCLEVAEHLPCTAESTLIDSLVRHGEVVAFSAAPPPQPGQNHVNCQWPIYWQKLFNERGYECDATLRIELNKVKEIEFWYKQNIFLAKRGNNAGKEPRLECPIHPDLQSMSVRQPSFEDHLDQIENGRMPCDWYIRTLCKGLYNKLSRRVRSVLLQTEMEKRLNVDKEWAQHGARNDKKPT